MRKVQVKRIDVTIYEYALRLPRTFRKCSGAYITHTHTHTHTHTRTHTHSKPARTRMRTKRIQQCNARVHEKKKKESEIHTHTPHTHTHTSRDAHAARWCVERIVCAACAAVVARVLACAREVFVLLAVTHRRHTQGSEYVYLRNSSSSNSSSSSSRVVVVAAAASSSSFTSSRRTVQDRVSEDEEKNSPAHAVGKETKSD